MEETIENGGAIELIPRCGNGDPCRIRRCPDGSITVIAGEEPSAETYVNVPLQVVGNQMDLTEFLREREFTVEQIGYIVGRLNYERGIHRDIADYDS